MIDAAVSAVYWTSSPPPMWGGRPQPLTEELGGGQRGAELATGRLQSDRTAARKQTVCSRYDLDMSHASGGQTK